MDTFVTSVSENAGIFGQRFSPNPVINDYYVPLFNDGTLTKNDICKNYADIQAAVIMVLKRNNEIIVPLFQDMCIAKDFAKRNMPGRIMGVSSLSKCFVEKFSGNCIYELLDFPKRINLSLGYEITGEIMDHDDKIILLYH